MRKIRVLFLVASPHTTTKSELDAEMFAIRSELQNPKNLVFDSELAASVDDLGEELDFYQPHIVHFIGSSTSDGIILPGSINQPAMPRALSLLFTPFMKRIRLVIVSAFYRNEQAEALRGVVDCVIGITDSTGAKGARQFATLFYRNISQGFSVQEAFDHGKSACSLQFAPNCWIILVLPDRLYCFPLPERVHCDPLPIPDQHQIMGSQRIL